MALAHPLMHERLMINNFVLHDGEGVLKVGLNMLEGEILYRKGQFEEAYECLERAVEASDNLVYDEPWGWMVPPRHALGALLLEQGHVLEAYRVYQKDLDVHANNLWSLSGQLLCLQADSCLVPNQVEVEKDVQKRLEFASQRSDQPVLASCFCARKAGAAPVACCSERASL